MVKVIISAAILGTSFVGASLSAGGNLRLLASPDRQVQKDQRHGNCSEYIPQERSRTAFGITKEILRTSTLGDSFLGTSAGWNVLPE